MDSFSPHRKPFAMVRALGAKLKPSKLSSVLERRFGPPAPEARTLRSVSISTLPFNARSYESIVLPPLQPNATKQLIELCIRLDASRQELGRYLYSKLYYCTHPAQEFSEAAVVCFEVPERNTDQRLQIELPPTAWQEAQTNQYLRVRIDGIPYTQGQWSLLDFKLVNEEVAPERTAHARRVAHRQWVREQVLTSEAHKRVELPHFPESISVELTPVCNLRCPHCSSHGMPHLHKHHNCSPEMPVERFLELAKESFPHISVLSLVGRGEPTLASDALWQSVIDQLRAHNIRMSCVTNGTRIRQRFTADTMPLVHELIFSIDGNTAETFEINREGAKFDAVLDNLRYYHELRNTVPLSRRPQLTISWTIKRNNVAELPDFVRRIAPFEPDLISLRHLVVFQDKERGQSLLDFPEEANAALSETYKELDRLGLRHESPPLSLQAVPDTAAVGDEPTSIQPLPKQTTAQKLDAMVLREPECNWMHRTAIIMADGEVITCGKHYGEQVGHLDESHRLLDLWNGPRMQSLRESYGTPHMWDQCKDCWLRELKWHSQRKAKDVAMPNQHGEGMDYSVPAWDYRRYSEL